VEDPKKELVRTQKGEFVRMKLKITIAYKGMLGSVGKFKNV
jgi:hypothetical protein